MSKSLDQTDYKIIEALQDDALKTNVQLAQEVGVSEGTIRKRMRWLIDEKYIKIITIPADPKKFGIELDTYIGIDVDMTKITEVAGRLADLPQITYVGIVTGVYDIIAHGLFQSTDELLEFMTEEIAPIPGIKNTETSHVLKVIKRTHLWRMNTDHNTDSE